MEKQPTVDDVRTALTRVDVFAVRSLEGVTQVVCADRPSIARNITELLVAHNLCVREFLLMNPDGKTILSLNDDGSVTQGNFDKAGKPATTHIHPAPTREGLTKTAIPA